MPFFPPCLEPNSFLLVGSKPRMCSENGTCCDGIFVNFENSRVSKVMNAILKEPATRLSARHIHYEGK